MPGSAAFRYRDELGFMNHYSFPTTQQQFLEDLAKFSPNIKSSTFFSGDVAIIKKDGVKIERQSSHFVRVKEDDSNKIIFKPVMEVSTICSLTTNITQHEKGDADNRKIFNKRIY